MAKTKSIKQEICPDRAAVERLMDRLDLVKRGQSHWAIVTDRRHRVQRLYSARSLELLADKLARARLQGRCFAVASTNWRGDSEEAVVAEWRLNRIAERSDSCFFAWAQLEPQKVRVGQETAAA